MHQLGRSTNQHDPLFDDASHPATNGDLGTDANRQPHINGHADPSKDVTAPITDVSSGIEPTAPFLPDEPPHIEVPFDPSTITATPTIATSVEQPISDARDEPAAIPPAEPLVEETQAMDINQTVELGQAEEAGGNAPDASADMADLDADASAIFGSTVADATSLPSRPASNGPEAMVVDAPSSGQVRPREEDDEDEEPLAKRTKVEVGNAAPADDAAASQPTANGTDEMPPPQTVPVTLQQPRSFDTNPITDPQRKFLQEKVRTAMKTKASFAFNQPVDPVALQIPTYLEIVKLPMDMGTMLQKLKDNEYKTVDEFIGDFETMVNNSIMFNGGNHPVTHAAMSLKAYFFKMMDKLPKADAPPPEKKTKKQPPPPKTDKPRRESRTSGGGSGHQRSPSGVSPQNTFPPDPTTGMPLIRRDSTATDGRPKREIHRPPPRDLPYTSAKPKRKKFQLELKFSKMVVDNLLNKSHLEYSYPFLNPVDPVALNIPTYHKIIKKPMDLGTINRNLKNDAYSNSKEVQTDIKLMFENCYKFNPPTDAVNQMGRRFEKLFDSLWSQKDQWIAREKAAEKGAGEDSAPGSSDESNEEEAEEDGEDEKAEKIRLLQEQVRALTASIQDIAGEPVRKKSPKATGKKNTKAKAAPKPKKTAITLPPLSKPAKKAPKVPQYNLSQKRTISETISSFNAEYMQQAVDVIRRLYPQGIVSTPSHIQQTLLIIFIDRRRGDGARC